MWIKTSIILNIYNSVTKTSLVFGLLNMGLVQRKKSGKIINGSKLNVPGQGISNVIAGGDNKINTKKSNNEIKK